MNPTLRLRKALTRLRPFDPYYYQCSDCKRVYPAERSTCSVCDGAVERVCGATSVRVIDSSP
ncbi:hypothetical protein [Halobaculum limi]|uniref:hypothetical protein n=1 Tax=Halobaculum limi TaxID=3031916 RepID=UPI002406A90C|nr:hypothetical protein [Halobaculum sp. YSMS11]